MKGYFFDGIDENIIHRKDNEKEYNAILTKWADHFLELKRKGLVPLFITGAGVSMDVETNGSKKIPNIYGIIDLLEQKYEEVCKGQPECKITEVDDLFKTLKELKREDKKDRSTVARLLNIFQENKNKTLESIWKEFNDDLVNIIIDTKRSPFHANVANIHRKCGAVTLTLNFDGLLIREFEQYGNKNEEKAFSLPTKEECENFFLRHKNESAIKEYLEIQIRGDIFYVICDSDGFCPQKGKQHSLWAFIASYPRPKETNENFMYDANFLRKCHACGKPGKSFLSFPGSYDKEKSMREMLEIVWKYLSFRIGSVTVTGASGEWDPLLIAFLGDLLAERDVPMLVIDKEPKRDDTCKYIIEELVNPNIHDAKALGVDAGIFVNDLTEKLNHNISPKITVPSYKIDSQDDRCWSEVFDNHFPTDVASKIKKLSQVEIDLISMLTEDKGEDRLNKISQLGLKSYWLDIDQKEQDRHNRFHHSL
ncbi:MAG: hypothetical protein Q8K92_13270, partial [Leadbetterella sp.]|nr:hypothetical protein [Leadbetterella sp.]